MPLNKLAAGAAILCLSAQAAAQPACLTTSEAETVVQALLPSVIETVGEQCAPFLPANSAMTARSDALMQRYTPAAEMARDEAASVALRILNDGESPPPVAEESGGELVLGLFEMGIAVAMNDMLDADSCPTADRVFMVIEPLPSRNFASLLVLLMEIGSRDDEPDEAGPFAICEAATG